MMGVILKLAGGLSLLYFMFGGQIVGAIYDRIEYSFGRLDARKIRFNIQQGRLTATMRLNMSFRQSFGINLGMSQISLGISQQGQYIGQIRLNQIITLPNATTVDVPFDVVVPASPFLSRLQEIVEGRGQWFAPIDIRGTISLTNGTTVPISAQLKILSV